MQEFQESICCSVQEDDQSFKVEKDRNKDWIKVYLQSNMMGML